MSNTQGHNPILSIPSEPCIKHNNGYFKEDCPECRDEQANAQPTPAVQPREDARSAIVRILTSRNLCESGDYSYGQIADMIIKTVIEGERQALLLELLKNPVALRANVLRHLPGYQLESDEFIGRLRSLAERTEQAERDRDRLAAKLKALDGVPLVW